MNEIPFTLQLGPFIYIIMKHRVDTDYYMSIPSLVVYVSIDVEDYIDMIPWSPSMRYNPKDPTLQSLNLGVDESP